MTSLEYCLNILRPAAEASQAARHCLSLNAMAWPLSVVCSTRGVTFNKNILQKVYKTRLGVDKVKPKGWFKYF